jgi:hypothetical protein
MYFIKIDPQWRERENTGQFCVYLRAIGLAKTRRNNSDLKARYSVWDSSLRGFLQTDNLFIWGGFSKPPSFPLGVPPLAVGWGALG